MGRRAIRKQIGVLVVQSPELILGDARTQDDPIDFGWIAEARLAGIVCAGGAIPSDLEPVVAAQANATKLFLMIPESAGPAEPEKA